MNRPFFLASIAVCVMVIVLISRIRGDRAIKRNKQGACARCGKKFETGQFFFQMITERSKHAPRFLLSKYDRTLNYTTRYTKQLWDDSIAGQTFLAEGSLSHGKVIENLLICQRCKKRGEKAESIAWLVLAILLVFLFGFGGIFVVLYLLLMLAK